MSGIKKAATVAAFMAAGLLSQPAAAVPVGLELALLVDVSGSVDASEFALQRDGYVQAFQSAAVQNAIMASQGGAIAATLIYWSGSLEQSQVVGWTLINSALTANAFASAIQAAPRPFAGQTAPGSAIAFADGLFGTETGGLVNNGFESLRQVIDVSGDGVENQGVDTLTARNAALAAGVDTINGLAILGDAGVQAFYQNEIVGGTNGFLVIANDFGDFASAIQAKLIKEVTVPEPGTLGLLALALLGFGGAMRRRT